MTPNERCIAAAVEAIDEDVDRAAEGFELELMAAPELPEAVRGALFQRFLADLRIARERHVAAFYRIFSERATSDETLH